MELEGFARDLRDAAIESIQRSKQVPFSRVLLGLNIPVSAGCSPRTSRALRHG